MQKIYLAGSCSSNKRTFMKKIAEELRKRKYIVYCPFELKIENAWDMSQEEWSNRVFSHDVAAINNCDIFLMISDGRNSTAGTNFEQGYAYAKRKHIIVVQYTENETSLMTYCGCDFFINTDEDKICKEIIHAIERPHLTKGSCKTYLT